MVCLCTSWCWFCQAAGPACFIYLSFRVGEVRLPPEQSLELLQHPPAAAIKANLGNEGDSGSGIPFGWRLEENITNNHRSNPLGCHRDILNSSNVDGLLRLSGTGICTNERKWNLNSNVSCLLESRILHLYISHLDICAGAINYVFNQSRLTLEETPSKQQWQEKLPFNRKKLWTGLSSYGGPSCGGVAR